ncbi:hypothetical protein GCM10027300_08530 [Modestobacter lapidis]
MLDRIERRVARHPGRVRGRPVGLLVVRVARRFAAVRVTGLAAEMSYYLVLSLVPLVTALGASLGLLDSLLGAAAVREMENLITSGVQAVLSPDLAADVVVPLVRELLRQEQVGVAVGSLAGALWLGSRVFRAAMRALGDAYRVEERRSLVALWGLSLAFTLAAVVVVTVLLSLLVAGPLLGGGRWLADLVGAGRVFEQVWAYGRWPLALLVGVAFLAWLYRAGQTADTSWRQVLPGALLSSVLLVALATGFRLYVDVAGPRGPDVQSGSDAVSTVGRFIGTAVAAMLFGWLASIVLLLGGVFNVEWQETAGTAPSPPVSGGTDGRARRTRRGPGRPRRTGRAPPAPRR